MFGSIILALAAGAMAPEPAVLEGRCNYPATLGEPRPGELRTFCHSIALSGSGVAFGREGVGQVIRFYGEWSGDRMIVGEVDPPVGNRIPARGECAIYRKYGEISAVSCVASQGARTWVANFIVPGA